MKRLQSHVNLRNCFSRTLFASALSAKHGCQLRFLYMVPGTRTGAIRALHVCTGAMTAPSNIQPPGSTAWRGSSHPTRSHAPEAKAAPSPALPPDLHDLPLALAQKLILAILPSRRRGRLLPPSLALLAGLEWHTAALAWWPHGAVSA